MPKAPPDRVSPALMLLSLVESAEHITARNAVLLQEFELEQMRRRLHVQWRWRLNDRLDAIRREVF
jgi:hypothetical protein